MLKEINIEIDEKYKSFLDLLLNSGFYLSDYKKINYGIQINIEKSGQGGILRIYLNKKNIVKLDLSQIKNLELKKLAEISLNVFKTNTSKLTDIDNSSFTLDKNFVPLIGTDESGKGDYFGPLVTAAVYVDAYSKKLLEESGIKDSKKISDKKIKILAEVIKNICSRKYSVIEVSPEKYNLLYDRFQNEKKNLNTLLAWTHAKAIEETLDKVDCENVLSDKFGDEKFILSKLQEKGKRINLRQEHKAENNIAVAAASILARDRFLERMEKLSSEFHVILLKGASKQVVDQAKKLVEINGKDILRRIAKLHFKTTKQI